MLDVLTHRKEVQAPVSLQDDTGVGIGGVKDHGDAVCPEVVEQFVLVESVVWRQVVLGNHHDSVQGGGGIGV